MTIENDSRVEPGKNDDVALAMGQVLQAEVVGSTRVAECRRAAANTTQAARSAAEAILRRADSRIARLHTAYRARIEVEVASASQSAVGAGIASVPDEEARIADAVARLAVQITS